jgi:uncharacterized membrane protein YphA (DoxX/SURF4 family)
MNVAVQIARFLVGGLFIFSGIIKINDPVGTAIKLEEYFTVFATDFAPFFTAFVPFALFLSVVLSVLEVVLGVAVLLNYRMKITAWILVGLIVFFTFLTFYSAYFDKVTDCGCFGDAIKLTPWQSFIKDIILLVLVVFIFLYRKTLEPVLSSKASDISIGLVTALNIFLAVYAIQHLPYIDFRPYKVGKNVPAQMMPEEDPVIEYVFLKDGEQVRSKEFLSTDNGYEYVEAKVINEEKTIPKISDYQVTNIEGEDFTEQTFEGNKLLIIIHDASKADVENVKDINRLVEVLPSSIEPMVLTSSSEKVFDAFRHEVQLAVPYYFTDATVLKAMIRSNPGLMLLQQGTVLGKWHGNDVPDAGTIEKLVNQPLAKRR